MPEPVSQQNNVQYAQSAQGQYMSTIQQPTNTVGWLLGRPLGVLGRPQYLSTMPQQTNVPYSSVPFQMQYSSAPPQVVQYAAQVVQYAPAPVQQEMMSRPVPKCAWDVRTVLVPKMVTEEYVEMQPRIVAVVLRKMVPKVIQVEETYEVEAECMEEEFFYAQQNNVQQYANANTSAQYRSSSVFTGAAGYGETYSAPSISSTQSPTGAAYGHFAGAIKSPNLSAQTESPELRAVSVVNLF